MFVGEAARSCLKSSYRQVERQFAPEGDLVVSQVSQNFSIWQPTPDVVRQTTIAAFLRLHDLADLEALLRRADAEPDWYWQALLKFFDIRFVRPYSSVLDVSKGIEWPRWCVGGTTNVVLNCLDKHQDTPGRFVDKDVSRLVDVAVIT